MLNELKKNKMNKPTTGNRKANALINQFIEESDCKPELKDNLYEALVEAVIEDYSDEPNNIKLIEMQDIYEIVDSCIPMEDYEPQEDEDEE